MPPEPSSPAGAALDLTAARVAILTARNSAAECLHTSLLAARDVRSRHAFLDLFEATATAEARAVDALYRAGGPLPPLAGLAVSIKGLFDVQGHVTTAASKLLADTAPASLDCPAVHRLRRAGAALIGHTNLSEFAFSGVGINPHHGTPLNPAAATLGSEPRIPGGSTSGGAVSVAAGAAWAALGSDTGGSIRIPAALQGLVGFKNTARLTPTEGAIPLSTTLDTACAITRSVRDAVLLHAILADRAVQLPQRPLHTLRLAIPQTLMLDALEPEVAAAFDRAVQALQRAGARVEAVALPELGEVATINVGGGFSPVEAWAWHRGFLATREAEYDPRVAQRIRRGEGMSGADYIDLMHARRDWMARMHQSLRHYDAMLSPTLPLRAPPLAPLLHSDEAFFAVNARLLRNPSVINLLDGCALSLPCHAPGELPVGLMVWHGALQDDAVLDASLAIEAALAEISDGR